MKLDVMKREIIALAIYKHNHKVDRLYFMDGFDRLCYIHSFGDKRSWNSACGTVRQLVREFKGSTSIDLVTDNKKISKYLMMQELLK